MGKSSRWHSLSEAAKLLGVSEKEVQKMEAQGKIGTHTNGGKQYHLSFDPKRKPKYLPEPAPQGSTPAAPAKVKGKAGNSPAKATPASAVFRGMSVIPPETKPQQEWFGEKSQQVEPSALCSFGIEISSRYARAHELVELLRFSEACAKANAANYVQKAFYDSKAFMCSIDLDPSVKEGDAVATAILAAANATLSQFNWFDTVEHGKPLNEK